jgi:hypothetical protein
LLVDVALCWPLMMDADGMIAMIVMVELLTTPITSFTGDLHQLLV